ncbi:nicotinamidase-related amidase [Kribbella rubisoli]|uniref:Nicotinamidase-related amidase n=1 Tax=Kribbella rubisoli TaxID=3075929 RepID=A0A4V2FZ14_9ACTN|nr:cysteine hydrolase [Kribbella rubisoli]RZU19696.1 nicotinamidase-related amidase [Kribbella rubisoli]
MVLALIDLQRIFADPESGWATPGFERVISPTKDLLEIFGSDVVFTRFVAPEEPFGAWVPYYREFPFALQSPDADDYQLVDEFKGARTLDKTTFGAWGPELAARAGGRLVLGGVTTDCCVISTALAAIDAGVQVQVVEEACAGSTDENHRKALDIMRLYAPMIEIVHLEQLR